MSAPGWPRSRRGMWAAAGALTVAAILTLAFGLPALTRDHIDPRAVSIIPFANRSWTIPLMILDALLPLG